MDKAAELKHSKPLKDSLWSEFEEVDNLVSVVLKEIKSALKVERFNKTKYKSNLKVLLLNLFVTYSVSPKMYLAVARGAGNYSTSRYNSNNIGYKVFVKLVNILSKLGYIEYPSKFSSGEVNRAFIGFFVHLFVEFDMLLI